MTAPWSPGWRPPRASADRYPALALHAPYGREGFCSFYFFTPRPYHIAPFAFRHREFFCACRGGKKKDQGTTWEATPRRMPEKYC